MPYSFYELFCGSKRSKEEKNVPLIKVEEVKYSDADPTVLDVLHLIQKDHHILYNVCFTQVTDELYHDLRIKINQALPDLTPPLIIPEKIKTVGEEKQCVELFIGDLRKLEGNKGLTKEWIQKLAKECGNQRPFSSWGNELHGSICDLTPDIIRYKSTTDFLLKLLDNPGQMLKVTKQYRKELIDLQINLAKGIEPIKRPQLA